jgi:crotonobetainyl-CoA:carnitine CoA-transferase CaiB-like acyl-CoA transferase
MIDLSEYKMLDLSWLLPGPYGTRLLADLGMDVIKIESPDGGDYARFQGPLVEETGMSELFHTANRNKRSVALDLDTERGQSLFMDLASEADVVVEQFRPGVVNKLGVNYEAVTEVNEDIVYCSLSGYGQTGPYSGRVGHDINYAGLAGLMNKTKARGTEVPTQPGFPIGDMAGGLATAFCVITGLLNREIGNGGGYFDISMTDVIFSMATGQEWAVKNKKDKAQSSPEYNFPPAELTHPSHTVYPTADEGYLTVAAVEEKFWSRLLKVLGREDLEDYQFAQGERARYAYEELEDEFRTKTRDEWDNILSDEVPVAPVNTLEEAFEHPQIQTRDLVDSVQIGDEQYDQIDFPINTEAEIPGRTARAPHLGEHSKQVLTNIIDESEFKNLVERGITYLPEISEEDT